MRRSVLRSIVASVVLLSVARVRAADDELPTGSDPPRIVPLVSADAYWAYHDTPPAARDATLMTSPSKHNQFQIGLVSLGARLEHAKLIGAAIVQAGTSVGASYAGTYPPGSTLPYVQEANVGWRFSQDISVVAGLFKSHFGNESFGTFGNWNYAHAMLSDARPYYLAGVQAKWNVLPTLAVSALVYNGWQAMRDVNDYKSAGFRVDWSPTDWLQIFDAASFGPETIDSKLVRYFDDLVVRVQPHARVGVAAEGYGGLDHGGSSTTNPTFWGAALWLRWFFAETTFVAIRGERLVDGYGQLAGCGADSTCTYGQGPKLWGGTITFGWQPHPMFLFRVEGVHRRADRPFFAAAHDSTTGGIVGARDQSTTFSTSVVFNY